MNNIFRLVALALLSTRCIVRSDDVGLYYNPEDGEAWEMDFGYYPFKSYQTTDLISPAFRKTVDSPQCYDDLYTFFTPRGYSIEAPGPMIVDNSGELVWAKSTEGQAYNLVMHEIKGQRYLTYWIGDDRIRGHGQGDWYMLNSSYQQVAKVSAIGDGLKADLHELVITPEGTALITIYQVYPHDLREFREFGEDEQSFIWDCLFQEINLETNELLFQWRVSDHHAIDETFRMIGDDGSEESPWDWFHINSVQKDELGNYVVSSRYTHTVTYINGTSGDIIWILGGKRNTFSDLSDGLATRFANQHDARIMPLNVFPELLIEEIRNNGFWEGEKTKDGVTTQLVTMFDNSAEDGNYVYTDSVSHALLLEISYPSVGGPVKNMLGYPGDLEKRQEESEPGVEDEHESAFTVRLVHSYDHPQGVISSSQGSVQVLPASLATKDPKILVGYGFNAIWTEYAADGSVLCDTHFATKYSWERGDVQSYRVFKFPWVGRPADPPTAVLGDDAMFVSWNGATEVKSWVLQQSDQYQSEDESAWSDIASADKTTFETEIEFDVDTARRYLRVLALDVHGNVLGVSRGVDQGWTAGLTSTMPNVVIESGVTPLKLLILFAGNVTALVLLYECYKKFSSWRRGREWRKHKDVRLSADVYA